MKQTSSLTQRLAVAQEQHAVNTAVIFRLYTEDRANLFKLVSRYFDSATFINATGLWRKDIEFVTVIEIVGTLADVQKITFLAGDICEHNEQSTVLITWTRSTSFLFERPVSYRSPESAI